MRWQHTGARMSPGAAGKSACATFLKICIVVLAVVFSAFAQAPPKVKNVRLYVFDCGKLKSGNPSVLLERGVTTTDMSVEAFLIVHPRGTLLWDAGVIPDELVQATGTTEARAT